MKYSGEPLICPYVQPQICWSCLYFCQFKSVPIARGAVYLCDVKEWKKCSSLVRAHTVSTRQNTFTAAVIDCLCNNHTPPASFFRKKHQIGADGNRSKQIAQSSHSLMVNWEYWANVVSPSASCLNWKQSSFIAALKCWYKCSYICSDS